MRRLLLYSGALGLVALGIGGCGGGGDDETTAASTPAPVETPPALSSEELIERGDGICAEVNAAVGTIATSESSGASLAVQVADLYTGMADSLRDLGTPSDEAGYSEFAAAADQLAQAESDVQLAAERGEEEALASAEAEASSALASFQAAATDYGFEECAEGPSAPVATAPAGEAPAEEPSEGVEEEIAPEAEAEEEVAPEAGGAGSVEEGSAGGGATAGGGTEGGGETGGASGGVGPG